LNNKKKKQTKNNNNEKQTDKTKLVGLQVTILKQRIEPNLIPQSPLHTRMIVKKKKSVATVLILWNL